MQAKEILPCACEGGVCKIQLYFHLFLTSLLDRDVGGGARGGAFGRDATL